MDFDDAARLEALADYRVLDTPEEEAFDNFTELTAKLFQTPIALVTLVDEHRQWFKSHHGFEPRETPREQSFCDHAIRADALLMVPDASTDERFRHNPLVTGEAAFRFYCGVPLRTPGGQGLGTLCLIDRVPRTLTQAELSVLKSLGRQVEIELEIRRRLALLEEALNKQGQAQRSKELLAAMLVHDLRSPLTSLMMLGSLVRPADDESGSRIEEILAETERMRHMLSDILDICLNEVDTLHLRRLTFDLGSLAREVARRMERLGRVRHQPLKIEIPDSPTRIYADRQLLERVLENLVGNAIHHGPPGHPITIAVRVSDAGQVQGEVRDHGKSIPLEARDRIFRVLERLEPALHSDYRGNGLGLAFCRLAIKAHGGSIAVSPDLEGGNCFRFEIPSGPRNQATEP